MTRKTPDVVVDERLKPQAQVLNMTLQAARPTTTARPDLTKEKELLNTANALQGFLGSATKVNEVLTEEAKAKAQEAFIENKDDFSDYVKKHPYQSWVNPHIKHEYNKLKLNRLSNEKFIDFATKFNNDYTQDSSEYIANVEDFTNTMYKDLIAQGFKAQQIAEIVTPKLNQWKQNSVSQYVVNHAKHVQLQFKGELTLKIANDVAGITATSQNPIDDVASSISASIKEYGDLNGYKNQEISDILTNFINMNLDSGVLDINFTTEDLKQALGKVRIQGKTIAEVDPTFFSKLSQRFRRHEFNEYHDNQLKLAKEEQDLKETKDNLISSLFVKLEAAASNGETNFTKYFKELRTEVFATKDLALIRDMNELTKSGLNFNALNTQTRVVESDTELLNTLYGAAFQGKLTIADVLKYRDQLSIDDWVRLGNKVHAMEDRRDRKARAANTGSGRGARELAKAQREHFKLAKALYIEEIDSITGIDLTSAQAKALKNKLNSTNIVHMMTARTIDDAYNIYSVDRKIIDTFVKATGNSKYKETQSPKQQRLQTQQSTAQIRSFTPMDNKPNPLMP